MIFPSDFTEEMHGLLKPAEFQAFERALQTESPVSIRLHPVKNSTAPATCTPVPWSSCGYYLGKRPSFTFDPCFHAGCYYVQEASSMFLEQVLRQHVNAPVRMLDMCAAPGGKATLAISSLPKGSLLVANEAVPLRAQILMENMIKWGYPEVMVTQNDSSAFASLTALFDVVLTDAPCSGEGMFRKESGAVNEWSLANVRNCQKRQRRILADSWSCLKPGGLLVYSTCTYNTAENEENVVWLIEEMRAEPIEIKIKEEWGISGSRMERSMPVYRFFPHLTRGEGFFMAVLRKPQEEDKSTRSGNKRGNKRTKPSAVPHNIKEWVMENEEYDFQVEEGNRIVLYSKAQREITDYIRSRLRVKTAGTAIAEKKGNDWVPHHALSMSLFCRREAFPCLELNNKQAVDYLRRETALPCSSAVISSYILYTCRGAALGFGKNLGNRANNLYPNEWRIRNRPLE